MNFFSPTKLLVALIVFLTTVSSIAFSQGVRISATPGVPEPSSILEVSSTTGGVLISRMSQSQRNAISNPANGLLIYQTDNVVGFWFYNGNSWNPVGGTAPQGNSIGDLQYWTGSSWAIVPAGLPGQHLIFTANGIPGWAGPIFPQVTTADMSNVGATLAAGGGNVTSDGGASVTVRGLCWSTSPSPTVSGSHTSNGVGTGSFTGTAINLQLNTTYYLRAYATSSVGTGYGNQVSFTTAAAPIISIGEAYAGGLIFYIDGSGQHGLVISDTDNSAGAQWGCYNSNVSGTSQSFGTGQANTNAILSGCATAGIAARVCDDLVYNTYSDWFLPSKAELALAYTNLGANGIGGFAPQNYWASSQEHQWSSYFVRFSDGYVDYHTKDNLFYVRGVRVF